MFVISEGTLPCRFQVGYVMERDRKVAPKLRRVIADTVASDPVTFSEVRSASFPKLVTLWQSGFAAIVIQP